ncbi:TPA: hypothetical protein ACV73J_002960, partial [Escherichia coli]|nr:hypothetical protein [Escherichia coli]
TMKALHSIRESEMSKFLYWRNVDNIAESVLRFRSHLNLNVDNNIAKRIDMAVEHIEHELMNYFIQH